MASCHCVSVASGGPPCSSRLAELLTSQANQVLPDSDSTVRQMRALDQLAGRSGGR